MKIYGPELRQSALAALERGEKRRSVSLMFEVSVPTRDRWRRQQRQSGQVAPRPRGHLRCAFEAKESVVLEELLHQTPDATLEAHLEEFGHVTGHSAWAGRAKKSVRASERNEAARALDDAIGWGLDTISSQDAANWFRHVGYPLI